MKPTDAGPAGSVRPSSAAVDSVSGFLAEADKIWRGWSGARDYVATIWFRGHSDAVWSLVPGQYRPPHNKISEHRYRHDFLLRASPFLADATAVPASDWDWYFLMQHFGVPTRLLDWTESALVALYFATAETGTEADGLVWVLDPRALNGLSERCGEYVPIYTDDLVKPLLNSLWQEATDDMPVTPLAIDPPHNSRRLAAQRGKFTVHGTSRNGIESYTQLGAGLVGLRVPATVKNRLRRQLMIAGITEAVLFPGLDGLGREIRESYATEWEM